MDPKLGHDRPSLSFLFHNFFSFSFSFLFGLQTIVMIHSFLLRCPPNLCDPETLCKGLRKALNPCRCRRRRLVCALGGMDRPERWPRALFTTQPLGISHWIFPSLVAQCRFLGKFCCRGICVLLLGSLPASWEWQTLLCFGSEP